MTDTQPIDFVIFDFNGTCVRYPSEPIDDFWKWWRRVHLSRVEDVSDTQKALQIGDVQYVYITGETP